MECGSIIETVYGLTAQKRNDGNHQANNTMEVRRKEKRRDDFFDNDGPKNGEVVLTLERREREFDERKQYQREIQIKKEGSPRFKKVVEKLDRINIKTKVSYSQRTRMGENATRRGKTPADALRFFWMFDDRRRRFRDFVNFLSRKKNFDSLNFFQFASKKPLATNKREWRRSKTVSRLF